MLQEKFDKLNLPKDELLDTSVDSKKFEEKVETPENNIKINPDTLKASCQQAVNKAKEFWERLRNRKSEPVISIPRIKRPTKTPPPVVEEVTNLKDEIKKEPDLKTIEELKDPELASYPILFSKTVEVIHDNRKEDADKDMNQIKEIVEPDVEVPKDLPQSESDPYMPPPSAPNGSDSPKSPKKKPSWVSKTATAMWSATQKKATRLYHTVRDSDVGVQFFVLSVGVGRGRSISL